MIPDPRQSGAPERIIDLVQKLRALMDDPAASEGEREAARGRLRAVMERYRLTEADLESAEEVEAVLGYEHKSDTDVIINLIGHVLDVSRVRYRQSKLDRWISVTVTRAQRADLLEAWAHYRPILAVARDMAESERRRLRAQLRHLDSATSSSFIARFDLYSSHAAKGRMPTADELRRMLHAHAMLRDLDGQRWQRKAGRLAEGQLQLGC